MLELLRNSDDSPGLFEVRSHLRSEFRRDFLLYRTMCTTEHNGLPTIQMSLELE